MTPTTTTYRRTTSGYVPRIECDLDHSGNRRIYWVASERYGQCAGCGRIYAPEQIAEMRDASDH